MKNDCKGGQAEADEKTEAAEEKVKFTPRGKFYQILYEIADLLKGAAFPFIVMCVFSTTIILFYGFDDLAVQLIAVIFGEGLLIASFVMFGKQNGAAAYRKSRLNEAKRKLGKRDMPLLYRTGEYSPWKGFVIGFITAVPFLILQIIKCFGDYTFVNFMLEYACGWAISPLEVIGGIPQPYYLLMIIFPVGIHGAFYIFGRYSEKKRQDAIQRFEDDKRKGKKKHYYEENDYTPDVAVDMSGKGKGGGKRR